MDFPDYVPLAVQEHISNRLNGDKVENKGLVQNFNLAKQESTNICLEIKNQISLGVLENLDSLRKQQAETSNHMNMLLEDIECLKRIACDLRMREAYQMIVSELTDDKQKSGFIYAAWSAKKDFSSNRDRLKRAEKLRHEIASVTSNLASLICSYESLNVNGPDEFNSIPHILRQTDNHEIQGHNFDMWRSMRGHVLGDSFRHDIREKIKYTWGVAPSLSALLDTVAKATQNFTTTESGMIGDAIKSRQHNEKTEYLRAFANLLVQVHHLNLTPYLMRIMAIVGSVALNLPDIELTYDDVRKTLQS